MGFDVELPNSFDGDMMQMGQDIDKQVKSDFAAMARQAYQKLSDKGFSITISGDGTSVEFRAPGTALLREYGTPELVGDFRLKTAIRSAFKGQINYFPDKDKALHSRLLRGRSVGSSLERQSSPERQFNPRREKLKADLGKKGGVVKALISSEIYTKSKYSPLQNSVASLVISQMKRNFKTNSDGVTLLRMKKTLDRILEQVPTKLPSYKEKILLTLLARTIKLMGKDKPFTPELVGRFVRMANNTEVIGQEAKAAREVAEREKVKPFTPKKVTVGGGIEYTESQFDRNSEDPFNTVHHKTVVTASYDWRKYMAKYKTGRRKPYRGK